MWSTCMWKRTLSHSLTILPLCALSQWNLVPGRATCTCIIKLLWYQISLISYEKCLNDEQLKVSMQFKLGKCPFLKIRSHNVCYWLLNSLTSSCYRIHRSEYNRYSNMSKWSSFLICTTIYLQFNKSLKYSWFILWCVYTIKNNKKTSFKNDQRGIKSTHTRLGFCFSTSVLPNVANEETGIAHVCSNKHLLILRVGEKSLHLVGLEPTTFRPAL